MSLKSRFFLDFQGRRKILKTPEALNLKRLQYRESSDSLYFLPKKVS